MMKWIITIFSLVLCTEQLHAQLLLVLPEQQEATDLHFNEYLIQRNRIAAIHGKVSTKREGEPIHLRSEHYLYKFDASGKTIYSNTSFGRPGSGRDTASTTITYDQRGVPTNKLRNDLDGHYTYELEYDANERLTRQTYARVENLLSDRYTLKPGERTLISDEYYRYKTLNDTVMKITYLNHLELPYRERTEVKNMNGYVKRYEDVFTVSNRRTSIQFKYDEKGRIIERLDLRDVPSDKNEKHVYHYDKADNLITGEAWKDGTKTKKIEYLYDEKTMLLKARLIKSMDTNLIQIVEFSYEYQK